MRPDVQSGRSTSRETDTAAHGKVALSSAYALLLGFSRRSQRRAGATGAESLEREKPQVIGLRLHTERRVRKPMLYPLSYEGARA